jgi:Zinc knuckle
MKGEDLDTYISTFHHLRERAGWEPDAQGTMLMFRRGLKRPLATAIVERMHPRPQMLQQWYQSARAHHAAYTENKATFANPFLRHDKNKWEQALKGKGKSWRRNDDAMDVDAVDTSGTNNRAGQQSRGQYNRAAFLTNEERKTLLKERRCFNCRAQGHMSKQCPKKGKATTTAPTIRATEAATVAEPAPAYDGPTTSGEQGSSGGAALDLIRLMNDEERTKLLDDLCVEQGF